MRSGEGRGVEGGRDVTTMSARRAAPCGLDVPRVWRAPGDERVRAPGCLRRGSNLHDKTWRRSQAASRKARPPIPRHHTNQPSTTHQHTAPWSVSPSLAGRPQPQGKGREGGARVCLRLEECGGPPGGGRAGGRLVCPPRSVSLWKSLEAHRGCVLPPGSLVLYHTVRHFVAS